MGPVSDRVMGILGRGFLFGPFDGDLEQRVSFRTVRWGRWTVGLFSDRAVGTLDSMSLFDRVVGYRGRRNCGPCSVKNCALLVSAFAVLSTLFPSPLYTSSGAMCHEQ